LIVRDLNRLRAEQRQLVAMLRGERSRAEMRRIQSKLGEVLRQIRNADDWVDPASDVPPKSRSPELAGGLKPARRPVKLRDEPAPKVDLEHRTQRYLHARPSSAREQESGNRAFLLKTAVLAMCLGILLVCLLGMLRCEAATGSRSCANNSFLVGIWLKDPR